jgi:competence protein ComEA
MPGRQTRTSAHQKAVARRIDLLTSELAAVRGDRPEPAGLAGQPTHTRVRQPRGPVAAEPPAVAIVPAHGRHAARGRLTLGGPQLAVVALVVLAGLAVAAWWLLDGGSAEVAAAPLRPGGELVSLSSGPTAGSSPSVSLTGSPGVPGASGGSVTVDVAGQVRRPGIAVLDAGSRVVDALAAAGGARAGVDLTGLNLARVLVDGEQILVGVQTPAGVAATMSGGSSPVTSLVNINTADQVALESLPDVGPVTAQSILAWRSAHGSFTTVDQLLDVDGIGEATLAKLAPYVTL